MISRTSLHAINERTLQSQVSPLQHIVEPVALLLAWQPVDENHPLRMRRVVARIERQGDANTFRYLSDTEDFRAAIAAGFKGHPAFKLPDLDLRSASTEDASNSRVFKIGVLETLLRRLPPRNREDFPAFLAMHRLPSPFEHSDFALLGYTSAKLPSDGFSIVPVFSPDSIPCELILEIAGFRHEPDADIATLAVGDKVQLVAENDNPYDQNAIAICHADRFSQGITTRRIGYVNRAMTGIVRTWMKNCTISAEIERVNGKPQRPLVYIRLSIC